MDLEQKGQEQPQETGGGPDVPAEPKAAPNAKFFADSLLTYGTEITGALLLFINGVILARALRPEGRGEFAILILVPTSLFLLGSMGLFQGLIHGSVKDKEGFGARTANSILFALIHGSFLAAIGLGVFASGLLPQFRTATPLAVAVALSTIPALLLNSFARALILSRDDLVRRNLLRLIEPAAYLVGSIVFVVLLDYGVEGALFAWSGAMWMVTLLGLYFIIPPARRWGLRPDPRRLRTDLSFGIKAWGAVAAVYLLHRQDQFLVAYFLDSASVGHYAIARTMILTMGIMPDAVQAAFLPKVTALYHESSGQESMTPFVCRVMMLLSILMAAAAAVLAYPTVYFLYGQDYLPAVSAFLVFLPALALMAGLSTINSALQARAAQRWLSIAAGIALVVNLLLDLWMIPRWGILGASLASAIAYILMVMTATWAFLRIDTHLSWTDLLIPTRADLGLLVEGARAAGAKLRRLGPRRAG